MSDLVLLSGRLLADEKKVLQIFVMVCFVYRRNGQERWEASWQDVIVCFLRANVPGRTKEEKSK